MQENEEKHNYTQLITLITVRGLWYATR